jgi:hypothetical protein
MSDESIGSVQDRQAKSPSQQCNQSDAEDPVEFSHALGGRNEWSECIISAPRSHPKGKHHVKKAAEHHRTASQHHTHAARHRPQSTMKLEVLKRQRITPIARTVMRPTLANTANTQAALMPGNTARNNGF